MTPQLRSASRHPVHRNAETAQWLIRSLSLNSLHVSAPDVSTSIHPQEPHLIPRITTPNRFSGTTNVSTVDFGPDIETYTISSGSVPPATQIAAAVELPYPVAMLTSDHRARLTRDVFTW